jgi:predicted NBD/HSP70 family sugar kinase
VGEIDGELSMNVLSVDVGGTNVKMLASGKADLRRIPSGPEMTPGILVERVLAETGDWPYEAIALGYPGPVLHNRPAFEPHNLAEGWVGFDFEAAFGKPVRVINDAAMQALGSYEGGKMLFLGLGTGLGSAFVIDGSVIPLELAHLPYRKGRTFEDYVGLRGLDRLGKKKWQRAVEDVVARLQAAFIADYVVLGGGNVKKLQRLPRGAQLGDNKNAIIGGFRLWQAEGGSSSAPAVPDDGVATVPKSSQ